MRATLAKNNSMSDLTLIQEEKVCLLEEDELRRQTKFKFQNKQTVNNVPEIVTASVDRESNNSPVELATLNYMPYPYSIVEDYETIETIYDEILGTAKIFLVKKKSSGKVSNFDFNFKFN